VLWLGLVVGVRKSKEVRDGKGKEGVDVKVGREGIRSLVSCASGREVVLVVG
jgi:hypothetical protein